MPTKKELLDELKELGVDASPRATNKELTKLLKEAKSDNQPEKLEMDEQSDEPEAKEDEQPERLKSPEDTATEVDGSVADDLQQYQYRKNTRPGSPQSNPVPGSRAYKMKQGLLRQPRVRIFAPRPAGEDPSIKLSVNLNGYRLDLPKQTYLELPQQIADVIMDSLQQTEEAVARNQIVGDKKKEDALL